jgi:hypothetical protein
MISWVMSADHLDFSVTNEHGYALLDTGNVLKGRRVFYWSDPTEQSPSYSGIGPDYIQPGDKMIGAKRPSSDDYSFQIVLIVRNLMADPAKLVGDGLFGVVFGKRQSLVSIARNEDIAQLISSMDLDELRTRY